jgi:flagellar basal-body rod protein FlgG
MAASGALAYKKRLEVLANNLANANTVGFKQDRSMFRKFYESELSKNKLNAPANAVTLQAPSFWFQVTTKTDHSAGPLKETGNPFDMAINGKGFFCIQSPQGIQYTRRGDFSINAQGLLVTQEGWPVLGEGGEISIESQADMTDPDGHEFLVDEEGNVSVDGNTVDTLRIVEFPNTQMLQKVGDTHFAPAAANAAESKAEDFRITQGVVELSNVDAVRMMTEMIEVLRGYESYQKVIRSIDEVNSRAINDVGKS